MVSSPRLSDILKGPATMHRANHPKPSAKAAVSGCGPCAGMIMVYLFHENDGCAEWTLPHTENLTIIDGPPDWKRSRRFQKLHLTQSHRWEIRYIHIYIYMILSFQLLMARSIFWSSHPWGPKRMCSPSWLGAARGRVPWPRRGMRRTPWPFCPARSVDPGMVGDWGKLG